MPNFLSQDEIDALLKQPSNSATEDNHQSHDKNNYQIRDYDLSSQERIIRGRMPSIEMINERFARYSRNSLFNILRHFVQISTAGVSILKFNDYMQQLYVPTSLNLVRLSSLQGTGLFVLDAKLVYQLVDNFFGGSGNLAKIEGRDFTVTELNIIKIVLNYFFADLSKAWQPLYAVEFSYLNSEINPSMANIVSGSEAVVVSKFNIECLGGGGELHIVLPYSMLEPIRNLLIAGFHSDNTNKDNRFTNYLKQEILDIYVPIKAHIANCDFNMKDILNLKVGDIIPIELNNMNMCVNELPLFKIKLGSSQGKYAMQIINNLNKTNEINNSDN